jgi:hypothetical protein
MSNNLTGNPNCKGYWNLDPGAILVDSSGNGQTLTDHNSCPSDNSDFMVGTGSIVPSSSGPKYLSRLDADLCSGFPFKSGETNNNFTLMFWVKPTTTGSSTVIAKWRNANGYRDFVVNVESNLLKIYHGYGNSIYTWTTNLPVALNQWSFVIIRATLQPSVTQYLSALVYNSVTGAMPEYNGNAGSFYAKTAATTVGFTIGAQEDGTAAFAGKIDCVAIFNTCNISARSALGLSRDIYTYPYPGNNFDNDSSCKSWWKFDSADIYADSKGTARLGYTYGTPSPSAFPCMMQGDQCAYTYLSSGGHFQLANNSLPAGYPLKYGDPVMKASFTLWMKQSNYLYNGVQIGVNASGYTAGAALVLDGSNPQKVLVKWGGSGGAESWDTGITIALYHTVHAALVVDGVNKTMYVRIFDQYTNTIYEWSGTANNPMVLTTLCPLNIGVQGNYDEATCWNRLLSAAEIDAVRDGVYGAIAADPPDDTVTELTCEDIISAPANEYIELACQAIPEAPAPTETNLLCEDIPSDEIASTSIELLMQPLVLAIPHACEIELVCQDINSYRSGFFLTL